MTLTDGRQERSVGMDFRTGLKFLLQAPGLTSRPAQPWRVLRCH